MDAPRISTTAGNQNLAERLREEVEKSNPDAVAHAVSAEQQTEFFFAIVDGVIDGAVTVATSIFDAC